MCMNIASTMARVNLIWAHFLALIDVDAGGFLLKEGQGVENLKSPSLARPAVASGDGDESDDSSTHQPGMLGSNPSFGLPPVNFVGPSGGSRQLFASIP